MYHYRKVSFHALYGLFLLSLCMFMACQSQPEQTTRVNVSYISSKSPAQGIPQSHPGKVTCVAGDLRLDGSSSLVGLMQTLTNDYQRQCDQARITVGSAGSTRSLTEVENRLIDISVAADGLAPSNMADLIPHQGTISVFAVVINKKVQVSNLTAVQLADIYTGKVTNWKDLGGSDLPISPLCRFPTSGTRQAFENYVLKTTNTICGSDNSFATGDALSSKVIAQDGALGYDILNNVLTKATDLTIAQIDGQQPSPDAVKSGSYKFWTIVYIYSKPDLSPLAQALLDYMDSPSARQIMKNWSFLGIGEVSAELLRSHTRSA